MKQRLSEFITLQRGFDLPASQRVFGKVPVVASTGIVAWHNQAKVKAPGVVIGRSGSIGGGQFVEQDFWPLNTTLYVKDFKGNNPRYAYYALKTIDFSAFNAGAGVPTLNRNHIASIEIEVLPLPIQDRIAGILSDYDSAIANCRKQIALLEEAAMRLYREWFKDGKGEKKRLEEFIYFQEGPGIRNWQYVENDGTRFINIRCINNGDIDIKNANMISNEEANGRYCHFLLREGDIVMSCSGTLGRCAIVRNDHLPLCLNTSVIRFCPKISSYDYAFVYCYLTSSDFLDAQKSMANGAAQLNFGPKHLKQITLTIPDREKRFHFNDVVMPMLKMKNSLFSDIRTLTEARDRLLPKLMSGEIEV